MTRGEQMRKLKFLDFQIYLKNNKQDNIELVMNRRCLH